MLTSTASSVGDPWECGNRAGGLLTVTRMGGSNGIVGSIKDVDAVMTHVKYRDGSSRQESRDVSGLSCVTKFWQLIRSVMMRVSLR
jgi:hypothetical protein